MLTERINLVPYTCHSGWSRSAPCIDLQLITRLSLDLLEQSSTSASLKMIGIAVLEAVVEENVGIARRDDAAETLFFQRPWRVFTAGAATEVLALCNTPAPFDNAARR